MIVNSRPEDESWYAWKGVYAQNGCDSRSRDLFIVSRAFERLGHVAVQEDGGVEIDVVGGCGGFVSP